MLLRRLDGDDEIGRVEVKQPPSSCVGVPVSAFLIWRGRPRERLPPWQVDIRRLHPATVYDGWFELRRSTVIDDAGQFGALRLRCGTRHKLSSAVSHCVIVRRVASQVLCDVERARATEADRVPSGKLPNPSSAAAAAAALLLLLPLLLLLLLRARRSLHGRYLSPPPAFVVPLPPSVEREASFAMCVARRDSAVQKCSPAALPHCASCGQCRYRYGNDADMSYDTPCIARSNLLASHRCIVMENAGYSYNMNVLLSHAREMKGIKSVVLTVA